MVPPQNSQVLVLISAQSGIYLAERWRGGRAEALFAAVAAAGSKHCPSLARAAALDILGDGLPASFLSFLKNQNFTSGFRWLVGEEGRSQRVHSA